MKVIFKGDERSAKIKLNLLISTAFKAGTILMSFLVINVTYASLDAEKLGVWMTILSILSAVSMFDVGLGNGLRNRLSESLARGDLKRSRAYVSTTYALVGAIVLLLIAVSIGLIETMNLPSAFNVEASFSSELRYSLLWIAIFYLVNFLLSLINSIAFAYQDSAIPEAIKFFTNAAIVVAFYMVSKSEQGSLVIISFFYSLITLLVTLAASLYLFKRRYKGVTPSVKEVNRKYVRSLFSLSAGFFLVQVAGVIILATHNFIITQVLGPKEVFPYQTVYKIFSVFIIASGIVLTPIWSGFTDAYFKKDAAWIKSTMKKLLLLMIPLILGVVVMIVFARPIIKLWIGEEVPMTTLLIVLMGIYTIQNCWNSIFASFVSGIGKIKFHTFASVFGGIINIPLSIYFTKNLGLGSSGVILGTICSLMLGSIILPIQTYRIIKKDLK